MPPDMLVLLGLALGVPGAAAFVVHMASYCPLPPNGSATPFGLTIAFNRNPLLCYEPDARRFVPCDGGLLQGAAASLAKILNNGSIWGARAESRQRACHQLGTRLGSGGGLRAPPQLRIVPSATGDAGSPQLLLTCHVWGFYPPEVTVLWLRNGTPLGPGDPPPPPAVPNGDGTYQTRATLLVTPAAGDTFSCWVQHASLEEPLVEDWGPGLSPALKAKVAAAAVVMALGLALLVAGGRRYRAGRVAAGYTPLPGDTYPAGSI